MTSKTKIENLLTYLNYYMTVINLYSEKLNLIISVHKIISRSYQDILQANARLLFTKLQIYGPKYVLMTIRLFKW